MNVAFCPGDYCNLKANADLLRQEVKLVFLNKQITAPQLKEWAEFSRNKLDIEIIDRGSLGREANLQNLDVSHYSEILRVIHGDSRAFYLASRENHDSAQNNSLLIDTLAVNSAAQLKKHSIDAILVSSTPHSLAAWVFAVVAEILGIPVTILERAPIISRAWAVRGLDDFRVIDISDLRSNEISTDDDFIEDFIAGQKATMYGATDHKGYLVSRLNLKVASDRKGLLAFLWTEASLLRAGGFRRIPVRLMQSFAKQKIKRVHDSFLIDELPKDFVTFFLHYQPERASLPEGAEFTQQALAIRALRAALPRDTKLLVKEHPSTWMRVFDYRTRNAEFYRALGGLPGVSFISDDTDTFEVIDRSKFISTLTGKVGFQALLRSTPVVAFGYPGYKSHPSCFQVTNVKDLPSIISEIAGKTPADIDLDEREYLRWMQSNSVSCLPLGKTQRDLSLQDFQDLRVENFSTLNKLLLHNIELLL